MTDAAIVNMLSIDVEDYFHVSAFERISPPSSWSDFECRVERNTDRVLALLAEHEMRATFFVLGWVAQFSPQLVRITSYNVCYTKLLRHPGTRPPHRPLRHGMRSATDTRSSPVGSSGNRTPDGAVRWCRLPRVRAATGRS